jgi:RHS repeat-associated protein
MAYNANNLMTSFTATGVSVQTAYDAAGRRVRKIKGTEVTLWVYDASGRLAAEYRNGSGPGFGASTPEREYSYGVGRLVAVHESSTTYYRTPDRLGSTRVITDQTGAVKQRKDFFPYGEEIPADASHGGRNTVLDGGVATYNASLGVRQQFTGQQRDSETGLDYFWARNLSAPTGRFLSVDPGNEGTCPHCPQTWNAYLYVKNNPMGYTDPEKGDGAFYCAGEEAATAWARMPSSSCSTRLVLAG